MRTGACALCACDRMSLRSSRACGHCVLQIANDTWPPPALLDATFEHADALAFMHAQVLHRCDVFILARTLSKVVDALVVKVRPKTGVRQRLGTGMAEQSCVLAQAMRASTSAMTPWAIANAISAKCCSQAVCTHVRQDWQCMRQCCCDLQFDCSRHATGSLLYKSLPFSRKRSLGMMQGGRSL